MTHDGSRHAAKLPELLLDPKCVIALALDTGKTHEAAAIYITHWQHGRRVANRGVGTADCEDAPHRCG